MEARQPAYLSPEDYLLQEQTSPIKHEYVDGDVFAMAGTTKTHNTIALNIASLLIPAARQRQCRVYASDVNLRAHSHAFYYPDVMVVCQESQDNYIQESPCVLIEIISSHSVRTDKHEKRLAYLNLPSVTLYLLVDSRKAWIKGYYRTVEGWQEQLFEPKAGISIPCVDVQLSFSDVYLQTELAL
ncbi:MAG: Uma2 family endonuclease [Deinococcales bacterium]